MHIGRRAALGGVIAAATTGMSPDQRAAVLGGASGPSLNLDFLKGQLDSRITFTRASTAWEFDSTGTLVSSSSNVPRFGYNPTTLAARGLLIEEARTNSIRNNTMVGSSAGTPGVVPTNWLVTATAGLTTNVSAVGTENGISYIDVQLVGTTSSTVWALVFEGATTIAALQNQVWTVGGYTKVSGGSLTNVSSVSYGFAELTGAGAFIANDFGTTFTPTVSGLSGQRYSSTITLAQPTTAFIRPCIFIILSNAAAVNVTIRIGVPQTELGASATSPIPTTGAAVTRAVDLASLPSSGWYNSAASSFVAEVVANGSYSTFPSAIRDTVTGRDWVLFGSGGAGRSESAGGTLNTANTVAIGATAKIGVALGAVTRALVLNGGAIVRDANPPAVLTGTITLARASANLNGYYRSLRYWPRVLSNGELQAAST